jgi:predicted esterase
MALKDLHIQYPLPIFVYHGKEDDVVDCETAMKTYEKFISYGF